MEPITCISNIGGSEDTSSKSHLSSADFEVIFESHYKKVYNFISFRINNHHDTEELVSQVFEKVMIKFYMYDETRSSMEAWIVGIAKNVVNDYFRAIKRQNIVSIDNVINLICGRSQPSEIVVKNDENKALVEVLSTLSQKERTIIAMKFSTGLKNTEIAEIMDISESNVGSILHRTLKKMRTKLEKEV